MTSQSRFKSKQEEGLELKTLWNLENKDLFGDLQFQLVFGSEGQAFCWKLLQVQFTVDGRGPPEVAVKVWTKVTWDFNIETIWNLEIWSSW